MLRYHLPDTISVILINKYKIQKIDVLYKESDALSTKVLDTIDLSTPNLSLETIEYNNDDVNGLIKTEDIITTIISQISLTKHYLKIKLQEFMIKYLVRALAQEVSSNRVIYGNFVEKMTPPSTIPYSVSYD